MSSPIACECGWRFPLELSLQVAAPKLHVSGLAAILRCPLCQTVYSFQLGVDGVWVPSPLFDCGCSRLKVEAGMCDVYGPDGRPRRAATRPS